MSHEHHHDHHDEHHPRQSHRPTQEQTHKHEHDHEHRHGHQHHHDHDRQPQDHHGAGKHVEPHDQRHLAVQISEASSSTPSEHEKMVKMVEHWIRHNEEHAKSYRVWADRAREIGLDQVGLILDEVAGGALEQNGSFGKILDLLSVKSPNE